MSANGTCPNCGGPLKGDGVRLPLYCEEADESEVWTTVPDGKVVTCKRVEHPVTPPVS